MKIKKMTDEKCLETFLDLLTERVSITTRFVNDPDTDNITHQILQIDCGEYTTMSNPEPLDTVLRVATAKEQGITVN